MKIPISEIYPAVQAEGKYRTPAVFVRVWGCNLRCGFNKEDGTQGRCDTPYAVFRGDKTQMDTEDVIQKILEFKFKHVVFTGGEPMLFQQQLWEIIGKLPGDYFIEVETNGTISVMQESYKWVEQFNISIKLSSSNQWKGYDNKRLNIDALQSFPAEKSIFKFVVSTEQDLEEIDDIVQIRPDIPVTLMPQGETREQILLNMKNTLQLCLKTGYGFTNRDHIIAFDTERGV